MGTYSTAKLADMGYGDVIMDDVTVSLTADEVADLASVAGGTVAEIETARVYE